MDPTSHISSVTLFYYLIGAIPLTAEESFHLEHCSQCQSLIDEYRKYVDPTMIRAA